MWRPPAATHTDTHLHSSLILRNIRIFVVLSRVGLFRVHIISAEKCHTPFIFWNYIHKAGAKREDMCLWSNKMNLWPPCTTLTTYTVIPLVQISSNCWKNCGWVRKKQTNSFFAKRMNKWGTCHRIRAIY